MQTTTSQGLSVLLNDILAQCKTIKTLLENDREHFEKNNLFEIEKSNQNKQTLLTQLSFSLDEFNQQKMRCTPEDLDLFQNQFEQIKNEAKDCLPFLQINSSVVYSNLQNLKNMWDKVIAFQAESESVYDKLGNKVK